MENPRKGSYGYTIRLGTGLDMTSFTDISVKASASSGGDTWTLYSSTSAVAVGSGTLYSSALGLTFSSGEWISAVTGSSTPWATADAYTLEITAVGSGTNFISRQAAVSVDP